MHTAEAYQILELECGASRLALIKDAFRKQSLRHHPDKVGNSKQSHEHMTKINTAYELLIDNWNKENVTNGQSYKEQSAGSDQTQEQQLEIEPLSRTHAAKKPRTSIWVNGSREGSNMASPSARFTQDDLRQMLAESHRVIDRVRKLQAATARNPCPGINDWELRLYMGQQQDWVRCIQGQSALMDSAPEMAEELSKIRRLTADTNTILNWLDKCWYRSFQKRGRSVM